MPAQSPGFTIVVCFEDAGRRRFLVARHRTLGWELPGGRPEPGEGPLEAAVREFREETGHALRGVRQLLRQERPNGPCWVFTGTWGPPVAGKKWSEAEAIVETRFVEHLGDVAPLAFPDDPYEEMERELGRPLR